MDFLNKNKKTLLIASGIGVAGLGIYYLLKGKNMEAQTQADEEDELRGINSNSRIFIKQKKYQEMIEKLRERIKVEKEKGLSKQVLIQVNQAILELFKNDYLELFQNMRMERRKYINDLPKYVEEYLSGSAKTEKLLQDASVEVFKDLEIDAAEFEMECEQIAMQDPNFPMLMLYMLENLKVQIPSKMNRPLNQEDVVNVYESQLKAFDEIDFSSVQDLDSENMMICQQAYVSDIISIKIGIEEEDLIRNPKLMMMNPKIMELQHRLQERLYQQ